jgi:ABC-type branched-subunit amino acid transport system substrate-binding protein
MRSHRRRALDLLAVLLAAGLAAACTNVERIENVSVGAAGDLSEARGGPSARGSTGPGAIGVDAAGGTAAGPGEQDPAAGAGAGGPGGQAAGEAGGLDFSGCPLDGPLRLGVSYSSDMAAGLAAVGQPDAALQAGSFAEQQQAVYGAIVDDVNRAGGVAGCEVTLAYHDFSSLASDGFDGQSQKECAYFAEDAKVFAAYSTALETETLVRCLAERGVVSLFNGVSFSPTQRDFDRYRGFLYQPWAINSDRWASLIDIWNQVGFFGDQAKVGILVADDGTGNGQRLAYEIWRPKLQALGIEVSVFEYKWIRSYASVSDASTALSAAVLRFKSEGVTHVLPTPDGAAMSIFMTAIADSQDYRPAYGTTTASGGSPITASDSQSRNWVLISFDNWSFRSSVTAAAPAEAQLEGNPARARCDAAVATVQQGDHIFYKFCDALYFLEAALAGSAEVSPEALLAGAEALGAGMPNPSSLGPSRWAPRRYDANAHVVAGKWNVGSGAFDLVSPVIEVG